VTDEAALPDTGVVESAPKQEAADLVADLADEAPAGRMLIALDIDGTVLLEDDTLSPGVVEAAAGAQAAGHEVMLATGRSWDSTRPIMDRLGIRPEYAVCSNGAIVMRRVGDADAAVYERAHVETFDPTEVLTLLGEHLPDAHFLVELPEHIMCDSFSTDVLTNTRSITGSWFSTWYTNGNNLHIEHHAAMVVPINQLRERHDLTLLYAKHTSPSYPQFFRAIAKEAAANGRKARAQDGTRAE